MEEFSSQVAGGFYLQKLVGGGGVICVIVPKKKYGTNPSKFKFRGRVG